MLRNASGIYAIENKLNKKLYIGSSINVRTRKNNHFTDLRNKRHSSSHLQNAFNKYGEGTFIFKVLEYVDIEELEVAEEKWISKLQAHNRSYGYNSRISVTNNRGLRHSEETKKKISENRKGKGKHKYYITEETKKLKQELIKSQNIQQFRTIETEKKRLERLRESILGKPISNEHKECISIKNTGSNNEWLSYPIKR